MKIQHALLRALLLLAVAKCSTQPQEEKSSLTALTLLTSLEPKVAWHTQSLLKADFDFDGLDDYALGGSDDDRYVIGIVKGPLNPQSRHWTLKFSADAAEQGALCSVTSASIDLEQLDEDNVEGVNTLPQNSRGINLSDGACDAFHIFWDPKQKQFVWWRL